jgi:hypothetical protein
MKRNLLLTFASFVILAFGSLPASAQIVIRFPKLPKTDKPKNPPETMARPDAPQPDASTIGSQPSNPTPDKSAKMLYGPIRRDGTPRPVKDSVYVQAETTKGYWKAPGQSGYHSRAPKIQFALFYNHERDLKFVAEYSNPDGTIWFSEPLEIGNAVDDNINTVRNDRTNTNKILNTKSSIATGLFGFKIKESTTGETFYQGKFKVSKFLPPYTTRNQFDFYVDHDWEMPIGTVSFHYSNFSNFGDNIGGFELIVSMWFKGTFSDSEHGLEARLFYKGQQIATTAGREGSVGKESTAGGQRATEQSIFAADLYHWQKWRFRWKRVIVDNGGTYNHDNYPNAFLCR